MAVILYYFKQYFEDDGEFSYGIKEFIPSDTGMSEKDIYAGEYPKDLAHKVAELIKELAGEVSINNLTKTIEHAIPLDSIEMNEVNKEFEKITKDSC